jgi:hypothetical protein
MMYISVDIEADGPVAPLYSMVSLGAVVIEQGLSRTFYREFAPISDNYNVDALASCGMTREQTIAFPDPEQSTWDLFDWLQDLKSEDKRLIFTSDNPIFDGAFVFYYLHNFCQSNPFGWSGFSLTSFAKGWEKNMYRSFKHMRKTAHTHNALEDAKGNAEAFLQFKKLGLKC